MQDVHGHESEDQVDESPSDETMASGMQVVAVGAVAAVLAFLSTCLGVLASWGLRKRGAWRTTANDVDVATDGGPCGLGEKGKAKKKKID